MRNLLGDFARQNTHRRADRHVERSHIVATLAVVLVATLLNAAKPVHIDDTAYLRFAEQIAADPAHPYAFEMYWNDTPQPAIEVLAPPVYLYWLAAGVCISPTNPVVWHLMVFPWLALLAFSLLGISRIISGGASLWLVPVFLFSPVVLPGINLMLDIPALALALASLCLFLKALNRDSVRWSITAGVLLALAFETKYTAATMFPVWLGVAWFSSGMRQWRCLMAGSVAALLGIAAVEGGIAWGHGASHLLLQLAQHRERFDTPLVVYLCQMAVAVPAVTLLGLTAVWSKRKENRAAVALLVAMPIFFGILAVGVWAGVLSAMYAIFIATSGLLAFATPWLSDGVGNGVGKGARVRHILWWYLLCEVVYCVFVSPFPAMRRVLGPSVPLVLLAFGGEKIGLGKSRQNCTAAFACISIVAGLGIWLLDYQDARMQRDAAGILAREFQSTDRSVWFTGHWGWEFYAQRSGMKPIIPGRSQIISGDIVLVPRDVAGRENANFEKLQHLTTFSLTPDRALPVTMIRYYGGALEFVPARSSGFVVDVYKAGAPTETKPIEGVASVL